MSSLVHVLEVSSHYGPRFTCLILKVATGQMDATLALRMHSIAGIINRQIIARLIHINYNLFINRMIIVTRKYKPTIYFVRKTSTGLQ